MKRAKQFLALALTLALMGSLAAPALAAEEDENFLTVNVEDLADAGMDPAFLDQQLLDDSVPEKEQVYLEWYDFVPKYLAEHPEHYQSFDADAYFAESYGGWYSKEEFMRDNALSTQEEFKDYLWAERVEQLYDGWEDPLSQEVTAAHDDYVLSTYESRHPGELAKLETGELLAQYGYTKTLTPLERYMEEWGIATEAEARSQLLRDYAGNKLWMEQRRIDWAYYQAKYPEKWAEFDAEEYFAENYGGWYPREEYMANWDLETEEDFRAELFADYAETYSWYWDMGVTDWSDRGITLVVNGEETAVAVTAENGVTYASAEELNAILGASLPEGQTAIRAAAEAAGWDVGWNPRSQEVFLLDRERLLQGVILSGGTYAQQSFDRFDALMGRVLNASQPEAGKSWRLTETVDMTLTAFNSLDGDETHKARATLDALVRDGVWEVTMKLSAGELLDLLSPQTVDRLVSGQPQISFKDLQTILSGAELKAIVDLNQGKCWFHLPILALVDKTLDGDAWYALELPTAGLEEAAGLLENWNTAEYLYQLLLEESGSSYSASYAYYSFLNTRQSLGALMGGDSITEEDGTLTWRLDADKLMGAFSSGIGSYGQENTSLFKEYAVELSVTGDGKMRAGAVVRPDMDAIAAAVSSGDYFDAGETALMTWLMNLLDFRLSSESQFDGKNGSEKAELHWKNQFKLELEGKTAYRETNELPAATPPEGAAIVEL